MLEHHPAFETPEADQIIWRYLDLGRYLALLSSSALHFSRADRFEDKWEGEYPEPNKIMLRQMGAQFGLPSWFDQHQAVGRKMRHSIFVNCWHEADFESAAMWRLYGEEGFNLAIVSTVQHVRTAIEKTKDFTVFCGRVKYIDYSRDWISAGNLFTPFLRKRKSFGFESEVRFLVWDWPKAREGGPEKDELPPPPDYRTSGLDVTAELPKLVMKVLVSPKAADWYVNVIREVTAKYGLSGDVVFRSTFEDGPLY